MKKQSQIKSLTFYLAFLLGLSTLFSSCEALGPLAEPENFLEKEKNKGLETKTFYGPATPLGQGVARAWVSTDKQGTPLSIGVNISEHAIQALMEERK